MFADSEGPHPACRMMRLPTEPTPSAGVGSTSSVAPLTVLLKSWVGPPIVLPERMARQPPVASFVAPVVRYRAGRPPRAAAAVMLAMSGLMASTGTGSAELGRGALAAVVSAFPREPGDRLRRLCEYAAERNEVFVEASSWIVP